jgi:mono/diheme cytochrome c family protein
MKKLSGVLLLLATQAVFSQSAAPTEATAPAANSARDLLLSKCQQCHNDGIWRDQRQDARAWEATLYRMMGRGAVWSGEDIKTMASYLATDFGPNSPRAQRRSNP